MIRETYQLVCAGCEQQIELYDLVAPCPSCGTVLDLSQCRGEPMEIQDTGVLWKLSA